MSVRNFSDQQAIIAINNKNNISVKSVLRELGLSDISGSNYKLIYKIVKLYKLETSHWLGKSSNKGKYSTLRVDASVCFNRKNIKSHELKLKLIRDGYKEFKCEICDIKEWNNKPVPLELDHIDGNHENNQLQNLRICCPNCHAQQPTNGGKNKRLNRLKDLAYVRKSL